MLLPTKRTLWELQVDRKQVLQRSSLHFLQKSASSYPSFSFNCIHFMVLNSSCIYYFAKCLLLVLKPCSWSCLLNTSLAKIYWINILEVTKHPQSNSHEGNAMIISNVKSFLDDLILLLFAFWFSTSMLRLARVFTNASSVSLSSWLAWECLLLSVRVFSSAWW